MARLTQAFLRLKVRPFQVLKGYMPKSLFGRAFLILIVPVVLIQFITAIVFWDRHWSKTTMTLALNIAGEISTIVSLAGALENEDEFPILQKATAQFLSKSVTRQPRAEGFSIPSSKPGDWRANYLHNALRELSNDPHRISIIGDAIIVEVLHGNYIYRFFVSRWSLLPKTIGIVLWWEIGAPIIFILIAVLFLRNQVRPLENLASIVDAFGKGQNIKDFKPSGALEVRRVGHAFNRMRDRIRTMITQRTEMLAGISHDLRTPLTRMQLHLTMDPPSPERDALLDDVKEMMRMVEEYLAFARSEGTEKESYIQIYDLLFGLFVAFKGEKVHIIGLANLVGISMTLRPNSLKRALRNIITNALRYGEEVWVKVSASSRTLTFICEDDGPGIPQNQREEVFAPFVRLDTSRNSQTGGYGLGLAITKDVITAHGGRIYLADSFEHGGLMVTVHLPR